MEAQRRIVTRDWDAFDTRHVVYKPVGMTPEMLKRGYDRAYESFYSWRSIIKGASAHASLKHRSKHLCYSAGWKKFEPAWDFVIRLKQLAQMRPLLEAVLSPLNSSPDYYEPEEPVPPPVSRSPRDLPAGSGCEL